MPKIKKNKSKTASYKQTSKVPVVQEPELAYSYVKFAPVVKEYNYKEFKKVAEKVPFTQQEWADILHISERTLQRYAKDNGSFTFSVTDRILQIDKVIKRGVEVFGSTDKFINWIRDNPYSLEGKLSLKYLGSFDGISKILTQLGRIEHGLFA